jgi:hypothetical protein
MQRKNISCNMRGKMSEINIQAYTQTDTDRHNTQREREREER